MTARATRWGYAGSVLLAAAPVAAAGFVVGASVRDVLDDVQRVPSSGTVVVQLDPGERRSLLHRGTPAVDAPECVAEPLAGQVVTLEAPSSVAVVQLGRTSWTVVGTLQSVGDGAVVVRCPADGAWALAPDVSAGGFTDDLAAGLGRAWLLAALGLVAGAGAAVAVALRSRHPRGQ